jgi:hypothetical protein
VVPLPPLARPTIVAPHRSNKKRKILRALLRERPGLLRRLLRRKLQQKIVPVEIPGTGLVKIRSGVPRYYPYITQEIISGLGGEGGLWDPRNGNFGTVHIHCVK